MSELRTVLREIDSALENVLKAANLDVRNIIIGSKTQVADPKPPSLWVLFDDVRIVSSPSINREEWTVPVILAVTYQDRNPQVAREKAEDLADAAGDAVIDNRALNGTVKDIIRIGFYRGYQRVESDESIYGAGVGLDVRFLVQTR